MKSLRVYLFFSSILLLILFSPACSKHSEDITAIQGIIHVQEIAVKRLDINTYMKTIDSSDAVFLTEQKNWFRDLIANPVENYSLELVQIKKVDDSTISVKLRRSFQIYGKHKTSEYNSLFRQTKSGWKDAGLYFETRIDPFIILQYPSDLESYALIALKTERQILSDLEREFGYSPKTPIVIKLFNKQDVFLQSIKLSLPDWVGGWNEYGESIKMLILPGATLDFHETLSHESIHHMVSDLTNDNASYWLQEGMASYLMESITSPFNQWSQEDLQVLARLKEKKQLKTLNQLEDTHLEALHDQLLVSGYYTQSESVVKYLFTNYSKWKILKVFSLLKQNPIQEVTAAEKLKQNNLYTRKALEKVLGISFKQLDKDWYEYMEKELDRHYAFYPVFLSFLLLSSL